MDRLGIYLARSGHSRVAVLVSHGLVIALQDRVKRSLAEHAVEPVAWVEVSDNDLESAARMFIDFPEGIAAVVGLGGGKALDMAKYVGFLARLPYCAVPTSLSNDGYCSPQASLTVRGQRRSLAAALPRRRRHRHGRLHS